MRKLWYYFTSTRLTQGFELLLRDMKIDGLKKALEVERRRRLQLERILTETVHTAHDPHQCVLRKNDQ